VQTVPHAPQLAGSEPAFTQAAPQAVKPAVQEHTPAEQLWPAAHIVPHVPQFRKSVSTLVHIELQLVCPTEQLAPPLPPLPTEPAELPALPPTPGIIPPVPSFCASIPEQLAKRERSPTTESPT
jgi:hypothetical protein